MTRGAAVPPPRLRLHPVCARGVKRNGSGGVAVQPFDRRCHGVAGVEWRNPDRSRLHDAEVASGHREARGELAHWRS